MFRGVQVPAGDTKILLHMKEQMQGWKGDRAQVRSEWKVRDVGSPYTGPQNILGSQQLP